MATYLPQIFFAIFAAAASKILLKVKQPGVFTDNKPTPLAYRGAFLDVVIGRRRVAGVFLWTGERELKSEAGSKNWFESAWIGIALRSQRMHKIVEKGKVLIDFGIQGLDLDEQAGAEFLLTGTSATPQTVAMYPGTVSQPIDTYIADPTRVGVASRWPFLSHIVWKKKMLGQLSTWEFVEYEISTDPESLLTQTEPWLKSNNTPSGVQHDIQFAFDSGLGSPGTGNVVILGNHTAKYPAGMMVRLVGNAADGDYEVSGSNFSGGVTQIVFEGVFSGSDNNGVVEAYKAGEDGANPAHALDQLLFAAWPLGKALDRSEWNIDSLEALGVLMFDEHLPLNIRIEGGEQGSKFDGAIGSILLDIGCFITLVNGLWTFVPIRASNPIAISASLILPPIPSIESLLMDALGLTRGVYSFLDRQHNYKPVPVTLNDDGVASIIGAQGQQIIDLTNVTDLVTAAKVASRRDLESQLSSASKFSLNMNRQARDLYPGLQISVPGLPTSVLVYEVLPDTISGATRVECATNVYAVDHPQPVELVVNSSGQVAGAEADAVVRGFEMPPHLTGGLQKLALLRIRANATIRESAVQISDDGEVWHNVGKSTYAAAGGILLESLPRAGLLVEEGPLVSVRGPDMDTLAQFDDDEFGWRSGRLMMVIGNECIFVRRMLLISPGVYRALGLLRGRYHTSHRQDHYIGAEVYVFDPLTIEAFEDPLVLPRRDLLVRSIPSAGVSVDLDQVDSRTVHLEGYGSRAPIDPRCLRAEHVGGHANAWVTGEDSVISWNYVQPGGDKTGAGLQPYGYPAAVTPPLGVFSIRILDGGLIKRTATGITETSWTYENADMVADFGGEPDQFIAELVYTQGAYRSSILAIVVRRV